MMGQGMAPGWQQGQGPGMMGPGAGGGPMMGPGQGMGQGMGPGQQPPMGPTGDLYATLVDRDQDGTITADEAAAWHEAAFAALDADRDGALGTDEFIAGRMGPGAQAGGRQERRQARFEEMDKTGDGRVTLEEFLDTAAARFQTADRDGDGKVNVWEFRSARRG
jgi:hypothetical protein